MAGTYLALPLSFLVITWSYVMICGSAAFLPTSIPSLQAATTVAMKPNFGINEDRRNFVLPKALHLAKTTIDDDEDFPLGEEEYESDVDWDAEWKKVVEGKSQPAVRPKGNDIGDVERAALKAKREAEVQFLKVKSQAKQNLNIRSLQGDWKFWVGILVILSVATSLISASGQSQIDESFYI